MAIYSGCELIYEAAQHWKQTFLLRQRGVLASQKYSVEHFDELRPVADNLKLREKSKENGAGFLDKLQLQMDGASPKACQLLAELFWILHLGCYRTDLQKKKNYVLKAWEWSGAESLKSSWLEEKVLQGIGNPGRSFSADQRLELRMAILLFRDWWCLPTDRQKALSEDADQFARWVDEDEKEHSQKRTFRHMLLHLLFPDGFERIFSSDDRETLIKHHGYQLDNQDPLSVDRALRKLRDELTPKHGAGFDFYKEKYFSKAKPQASASKNTRSSQKPALQDTLALNHIFYGPPGTGKTYHTINAAVEMLDPAFYESHQKNWSELKQRFDELKAAQRIAWVTFHQSFSYEDFIEGLKAVTDEDGNIRYEVADGVFKMLCEQASDSSEPHILIIDEINRGNISAIFGELITLIEPTKRRGTQEALEVTLPYSKETFSVPNNLHIVGTMNTADRSLAILDTALRRRFQFIEMMPDIKQLEGVTVESIDIARMLETINQRIEIIYDREHTIGQTFFLPLKNDPQIETLADIFEHHILPLLQEYFFEDWSKIRQVLNNNAFIKEQDVPANTFKEPEASYGSTLKKMLYYRDRDALKDAAAYRAIYEE